MKYILTAAWDDGVADLTERLVRELADGKQVLWLVSGGSNIPASVQVMDNISDKLSKRLTVALADERYGEPGHSESNWQQLTEAGFDGKQTKLLKTLQAGADLEETVKRYGETIQDAFEANELIIAQLGIGPDGHLAGILPGSPAATEQIALVAGYEAPPLKRITLTFPAFRHVDAAYAFAFGKPKKQALEALQSGDLPFAEQPAQILKQMPEAYLYSDQVGEHV
ncbi:MAG TPA: 6-phosphogluconolactonase [Verrucomicrobiae bacterium]|nr:6-phosphogluconolactonase [Verrucomicrobiae bacterium]